MAGDRQPLGGDEDFSEFSVLELSDDTYEYVSVVDGADDESFLTRDTDDAGVVEFREVYDAAEYLVNPAFYDPDRGFFATRAEDGEDGHIYLYDDAGAGLAPADSDTDAAAVATVNALNALDLAGAATLVPVQERSWSDTFVVEDSIP